MGERAAGGLIPEYPHPSSRKGTLKGAVSTSHMTAMLQDEGQREGSYLELSQIDLYVHYVRPTGILHFCKPEN